MSTILCSEHRAAFLNLTSEVVDFQVDLYKMLIAHPLRPLDRVEVEVEREGESESEGKGERERGGRERVLCEECGPREQAAGEGYTVKQTCKGCGVVREIEFL